MNYDHIVNRYLTEAYFSSPYEKATGIKRQRGVAIEGNKANTEDMERKREKMEAAARIVVQVLVAHFEAGGDVVGRDLFIDFCLSAISAVNFDDEAYQRAHNDPDQKATPDEITLPDIRYFKTLVDTEYYKFMTPERFRQVAIKVKKNTEEEVQKAQEQAKDQALDIDGVEGIEARAMKQVGQNEHKPIDTQKMMKQPRVTDYAMELMRKAGKAV